MLQTIKEGRTVYARATAGKQAAGPASCADAPACCNLAGDSLAHVGVINIHREGD